MAAKVRRVIVSGFWEDTCWEVPKMSRADEKKLKEFLKQPVMFRFQVLWKNRDFKRFIKEHGKRVW